jgi:hypothetical protein
VHGDCGTALVDTPFALDSQPTFSSGYFSTTTLVNDAIWPQGEYKFCLRLQLWQRFDGSGNAYLWQEVDTSFTVDVEYEASSVQLMAPVQLVPIVTASLPSSEAAYPYGTVIPIVLTFGEHLGYEFGVNASRVLLVDDNDEEIEDANGPIVMEFAAFEWTQPSKAGVLTIILPSAVYEMALESVRVILPLTYEGENVRRGLRRGLSSGGGSWDEVIEIKLMPLESESLPRHEDVSSTGDFVDDEKEPFPVLEQEDTTFDEFDDDVVGLSERLKWSGINGSVTSFSFGGIVFLVLTSAVLVL